MAQIPPRKKTRDTLIAIVGPTASGKSDLGVQLAKKFNGEVISADSRQVYKGLDIGSGKITAAEMQGVSHHVLDVASPKRTFTVAQYQKLARKAINGIWKRNKLPILVGGSPFYIYSLVDNIEFPQVKPNHLLRLNLNKFSAEELFAQLQQLDPERAYMLEQNSGQHKNKRRLMRAIEIVTATGKPVPKLPVDEAGLHPLLIGIKRAPDELKKRIHKRLIQRINQGMIEEVEWLHAPSPADKGLSWKRLEELGLEYRYVAQYLQQKISKQEMIETLERQSNQFAHRQMAWFKRDPRIHWIQTQPQAEKLLEHFLKNV